MTTFILAVLAFLAAASMAATIESLRREVRRLRALLDPDRDVCMCGHDACYHGRAYCWKDGCDCATSNAAVIDAAVRRRSRVEPPQVQDVVNRRRWGR